MNKKKKIKSIENKKISYSFIDNFKILLIKYQTLIVFLLTLTIFITFSYLRFFNLDKRFVFDWDQENICYSVKNIINGKLTLIGPRVFSDAGFFLGPYFSYLLVPFFLLTKLHPKALIFFVIFVNVFFFWLSFFLLKKIFGKTISILFLSFWTINFYLIHFDTVGWWPVVLPLGIISTFYFLKKIYEKNKLSDWIILGLVLGFFVNMHFQFVFIILFSLMFLLISLIKREIILKKKNISLFLISFILMFLPLFIFDLRHQFLNTKAFFNFFFGSEKALNKDLSIWWSVFGNFLKPLIVVGDPFKNQWPTKIFYFLNLFIIFFLQKKEKGFKKEFFQSLFILWIFFPLAFIFWGKRPAEYYFIFLYPFIYLIIISFFIKIKNLSVLILALIFIFFSTKDNVFYTFKDNYFGFYYKEKVAKIIKEKTEGKKFNISFDVPLGMNHGFNYFFDWYQIKQTGDFSDPLIEVRIPPKKNDIVIDKIGIKFPQELK